LAVFLAWTIIADVFDVWSRTKNRHLVYVTKIKNRHSV